MFEAVFVLGQAFLPKLFGDGRAGHAHDSFIVGTWRRHRIAGEQLPSTTAATDWRAGQDVCAGLQPGQRSQHLRRQLGKSTHRFYRVTLAALMQQLIKRKGKMVAAAIASNERCQICKQWFRSVHDMSSDSSCADLQKGIRQNTSLISRLRYKLLAKLCPRPDIMALS